MRYKCKEDWRGCETYSRQMNGLIATLETAQWSMGAIFREMSLKNINQRNYHAMLRNMLLIRFANDDFSQEVCDYFNRHRDLALKFHHADRTVIVMMLLNSPVPVPLTYDNVLFLMNRIDVNDPGLIDLESAEFKQLFQQITKR